MRANFVLVLNILLDSNNQNQLQCAENTSWHKTNLDQKLSEHLGDLAHRKDKHT